MISFIILTLFCTSIAWQLFVCLAGGAENAKEVFRNKPFVSIGVFLFFCLVCLFGLAILGLFANK